MGRSALVAFVTSVVTTFAVFAVLTVADRRGMLDFLHGGRGDVEVPSINGVSVEQARDLLRARDLLLTLQFERPDATIPAGKIAGQTPLPGPSRSLVGSQARNRKLLAGHRREEASDMIAAGLVIGTDPPVGRSVAPDTDVTLIVSSGRALKPVPKVIGFRMTRAKKTLEDAGFKVGTTRTGSTISR